MFFNSIQQLLIKNNKIPKNISEIKESLNILHKIYVLLNLLRKGESLSKRFIIYLLIKFIYMYKKTLFN